MAFFGHLGFLWNNSHPGPDIRRLRLVARSGSWDIRLPLRDLLSFGQCFVGVLLTFLWVKVSARVCDSEQPLALVVSDWFVLVNLLIKSFKSFFLLNTHYRLWFIIAL